MNYSLNANMLICNRKLLEKTTHLNSPSSLKQQGSSIVLALFVIIILSLLGGVLMQMISTSSETVSQEVLGTRAYMAANSAIQTELQLLFPLNTIASGYCNTEIINKEHLLKDAFNEDIPGLYDCKAYTSCENYYPQPTDPQGGPKYYRLTGTGECGSGNMTNSLSVVKSSRTIQVEARSL